MTALRLALVAALAYSLGAREWVGVYGAAVALAGLEVAAWNHRYRLRLRQARWRERRPA